MIPKIIHYCWFGGKPKPTGVLKCIESWKICCPDYEIKEWNENNFNVNSLTYTSEAYNSGKWAFVSDVARLHALINQGGIYLDTDVELLRSFDHILDNNAFVGFEGSRFIATAVMGCVPGNTAMIDFLKLYDNERFVNSEKSLNLTTNVTRLTNLLTGKGLVLDGAEQQLQDIIVYPTDFFSPYDYIDGTLKKTANTIAIHWYSISWKENASLKKRFTQLYHRLIGKHRE